MKIIIKRYMYISLLCLFTLMLFASIARSERKILEKPELKIKIRPRSKEERWIGVRRGENLYEKDTKPEAELDPETGNYKLRWIGFDGKVKEVTCELPIKVDVIVKAEVQYDTLGKLYIYRYRAANLESSKQNLHSIKIEYGSGLEYSRSPEGRWYSAPRHDDPVWGWFDMEKKDGIGFPPGSEIGDFVLAVKGGLPGIVNCYGKGYTEIMKVPEELPLEIEEALPSPYEKHVFGKTVGSVPFPGTFKPERIIENLRGVKAKMNETGWMDKSVWKSYSAYGKKDTTQNEWIRDPDASVSEVIDADIAIISDALSRKDVDEAKKMTKIFLRHLGDHPGNLEINNFLRFFDDHLWEFSAESFGDYLLSLKTQSDSLGWIESKEISDRLGKKLELVASSILRKDASSANRYLLEFLDIVESEKDGSLLSEAYALLKFNGEYLIGRL